MEKNVWFQNAEQQIHEYQLKNTDANTSKEFERLMSFIQKRKEQESTMEVESPAGMLLQLPQENFKNFGSILFDYLKKGKSKEFMQTFKGSAFDLYNMLPSVYSQSTNLTQSNQTDSLKEIDNQQQQNSFLNVNGVFPQISLGNIQLCVPVLNKESKQQQGIKNRVNVEAFEQIKKSNQGKITQKALKIQQKQKQIDSCVDMNLVINYQQPKTGCKCSKSKCLRLYCECFAQQKMCDEQCVCKDCFNNEWDPELWKDIIIETLQKNPIAFKAKVKTIDQKSEVHSRGCTCSKTACLKKYCECFSANIGCSAICQCINCENNKTEIQQEELQRHKEKVLRKRVKNSILKKTFSNYKMHEVFEKSH